MQFHHERSIVDESQATGDEVLHANGETYTHALTKGDIEETRGVVPVAEGVVDRSF